MCQKLLTLCICCCALVTTVHSALPFASIQLQPDAEILPTVGAVSSQFIHRIHNKLISAPVVAPITGANSALVAAPLRPLPTPIVPVPSLPIVRASPLTAVASPPAQLIPVPQQVAPLVAPFSVPPPQVLSLRAPIVPAALVATPTRLLAPSVLTFPPTRFAFTQLVSGRLRSRLSFRRRPSAIAIRRYPAGFVFPRLG